MSDICNCYKETLERVKQKSVADGSVPVGSIDIKFAWKDRVYVFEGGHDQPPVAINIAYQFRKPKKGGGYCETRTKKEIGIIANYCPFCGRKYNK